MGNNSIFPKRRVLPWTRRSWPVLRVGGGAGGREREGQKWIPPEQWGIMPLAGLVPPCRVPLQHVAGGDQELLSRQSSPPASQHRGNLLLPPPPNSWHSSPDWRLPLWGALSSEHGCSWHSPFSPLSRGPLLFCIGQAMDAWVSAGLARWVLTRWDPRDTWRAPLH